MKKLAVILLLCCAVINGKAVFATDEGKECDVMQTSMKYFKNYSLLVGSTVASQALSYATGYMYFDQDKMDWKWLTNASFGEYAMMFTTPVTLPLAQLTLMGNILFGDGNLVHKPYQNDMNKVFINTLTGLLFLGASHYITNEFLDWSCVEAL